MDPATSAAAKFLELGVPGAVIIFLGLAVIALWRANQKLQEERLADVRKCTEALLSASQAMEKQSDALTLLQQSLNQLVTEFQARRMR